MTDLGIFRRFFWLSEAIAQPPAKQWQFSRQPHGPATGHLLSSDDQKFAGHESGSPSETRTSDPEFNRVTQRVIILPLCGHPARRLKAISQRARDEGTAVSRRSCALRSVGKVWRRSGGERWRSRPPPRRSSLDPLLCSPGPRVISGLDFMDRAICCLSSLTSITRTLTRSPALTPSRGTYTKRSASWEMCTRPSWCTPMSTKAPKLVTLVTMPGQTMPGCRSSSVWMSWR